MPNCRNCGAYTKYNKGLCKRCYYGRNQRQGGSFLGSFFEGETGDALERTSFSEMAIILLLVFGVIFFIGLSKIWGALMIGVGLFWIYKKVQRRKRKS